MSPTTTRSSFVVRVLRNRDGRLTGVIERVATGAKQPFTGEEEIGGAIARLLRGEGPMRAAPKRREFRSFDWGAAEALVDHCLASYDLDTL
jgi:hypothetical protein